MVATIRSMDEMLSIPIIVLGAQSSDESNEMKERFYTTGANEAIKKPVDVQSLIILISEYLGRTNPDNQRDVPPNTLLQCG